MSLFFLGAPEVAFPPAAAAFALGVEAGRALTAFALPLGGEVPTYNTIFFKKIMSAKIIEECRENTWF